MEVMALILCQLHQPAAPQWGQGPTGVTGTAHLIRSSGTTLETPAQVAAPHLK